MPRGGREWNRARLVHPMLYSHLPYILFTAFFSKSQNPSPGRWDAFREPFPASTRQSLPMVASPGPGVVRGAVWLQYRALVVVIYVFTHHGTRTAVFRTPASGAVTRADVECVRSIGPPQPTFLTIDNLLSNN